MSWTFVSNQQSLDTLIGSVDWSDAFVREVYLVSPSYVVPESRGTANPDAPPTMKVLITTPEQSLPALELLFTDVDDLCMWFGGRELAPTATWSERQVLWSFHRDIVPPIRAGSLRYRLLDESAWGDSLRYGWQPMLAEEG